MLSIQFQKYVKSIRLRPVQAIWSAVWKFQKYVKSIRLRPKMECTYNYC